MVFTIIKNQLSLKTIFALFYYDLLLQNGIRCEGIEFNDLGLSIVHYELKIANYFMGL